VLVSAPEMPARIPFTEARVLLKHASRAARFEHGFGDLDAVSLRNINLKMDMIPAEAKRPELEAERFELPKRRCARVDVRLFPKAVVPTLRRKHHRHPVISRVARRATETFKAHATQKVHHHHVHSPKGAVERRRADYGIALSN